MKYFDDLSGRIRRNEPVAAPWRAALRTASLAQRAGMWFRLRRTPMHVPAHVISFGNLTAGGTGKTPAVIERALREAQQGRHVAVITRGYGASSERFPLLMHTNHVEEDVAGRFGDEAALIAARVPGIWIVRSPDRVAGARAAMHEGCDTLILDDGYQAVRLSRDENILLIDATNPFGNGFLVPRGILREPVDALARSTEVIITRCDQAPQALPDIESVVRRFSPDTPIRHMVHKPVMIKRLCDGQEYPLEQLRRSPVHAVCGIGNPESFLKTLQDTGAEVLDMRTVADHAALSPDYFTGEEMTVVTEKDAARIGKGVPERVYALCISMAPYRPATAESASI